MTEKCRDPQNGRTGPQGDRACSPVHCPPSRKEHVGRSWWVNTLHLCSLCQSHWGGSCRAAWNILSSLWVKRLTLSQLDSIKTINSPNSLCSLRTQVRVIWIPNSKVIHVLLLTSVRVVVVRVWNWPGSFCVGKIGLKLIFLPCHLQVLLLWWCVSIPSLKNYVLNLLFSDSLVCVFVCMYVWVHVCACVCATRLVWQWEDNLCELVLSFHPVKLRYWT